MFPFGESVQIEAALSGIENAHGDLLEGFAQPVTVDGCAFDPGGSAESFGPGRDVVISQPRLFAPPGTVVTARSRVTVRGLLYVVQGEPAVWRSPFTGWEPGVAIPLERVEG